MDSVNPIPVEGQLYKTIHIDEHTRFVLSEYSTLTPQEKLNIKTHIEGHKLCAQSQTDQIPQPKYGE